MLIIVFKPCLQADRGVSNHCLSLILDLGTWKIDKMSKVIGCELTNDYPKLLGKSYSTFGSNRYEFMGRNHGINKRQGVVWSVGRPLVGRLVVRLLGAGRRSWSRHLARPTFSMSALNFLSTFCHKVINYIHYPTWLASWNSWLVLPRKKSPRSRGLWGPSASEWT